MIYTVYRIENQETMNGLWYNLNRECTAFIKTLSNAKCKDLPMPYDEELYAQDGLAWFSATAVLHEIPDWCSLQDLAELEEAGYYLYAFTVSHYRDVPGHVVFAREHIIDCERLDLSVLQSPVIRVESEEQLIALYGNPVTNNFGLNALESMLATSVPNDRTGV